MTRSYRQFCALARALDHVGDRWTLLIVRELIRGPRTFASLSDSLAGIGPSLLTDRLASLQRDGLVTRSDAPRRSKAVTYALTPAGAELEPILLSLVRWGSRFMASGPAGDRVDAAWSGIALKAHLDDTSTPNAARARRTIAHIRTDEETTTVTTEHRTRHVTYGATGRPDAIISGSFADVLAVASGLAPFDAVELTVDGDIEVARAAIAVRT